MATPPLSELPGLENGAVCWEGKNPPCPLHCLRIYIVCVLHEPPGTLRYTPLDLYRLCDRFVSIVDKRHSTHPRLSASPVSYPPTGGAS